MQFAQRLNELMKNKNTSNYKLAKLLGVHQTTVANWRNGSSEPSASVLISIADYFDVSTDYLTGRSDDSKIAHFVVGFPDVFNTLIVSELCKRGVAPEKIKNNSTRGTFIGPGFVIDDLSPSEAKTIQQFLDEIINVHIKGLYNEQRTLLPQTETPPEE